jgi:hypothetical protein
MANSNGTTKEAIGKRARVMQEWRVSACGRQSPTGPVIYCPEIIRSGDRTLRRSNQFQCFRIQNKKYHVLKFSKHDALSFRVSFVGARYIVPWETEEHSQASGSGNDINIVASLRLRYSQASGLLID